jgi:DNA-binding NarL/FixJ family response regulator
VLDRKASFPFHREMATRIVLADDHRIVREGLRSLISSLPGAEVIAEAENGRMTVELTRKLSPDVVVMDIGMPDLNGIEATRQIIAEFPSVKVIGLSMHADVRYVAEMLRAGASGYLLKDSAFEELAQALQTVIAGHSFLSPAVSETVVKDYVRCLAAESPIALNVLTSREKEVLQLLAEGHSTKEIATRLQVSAKTADSHRQQVMNKLGLRSVAELTKYAVREGLTSL